MPTCHREHSDYKSYVAAGQHDVLAVGVLLRRLLFPRRPQADEKDEDVEYDNGGEPDQMDSHASLWLLRRRSGKIWNNDIQWEDGDQIQTYVICDGPDNV